MDRMKIQGLVQAVIDSVDGSELPGDLVQVDGIALGALVGYIKPATSEDYVADKGQRCPFCGSASVNFDDEWCLNGCVTSQGCDCIDCEATWDEEYTLTGFTPTRPT